MLELATSLASVAELAFIRLSFRQRTRSEILIKAEEASIGISYDELAIAVLDI